MVFEGADGCFIILVGLTVNGGKNVAVAPSKGIMFSFSQRHLSYRTGGIRAMKDS